ncbi:serine hydrolase [Agromyces sp. NPDC056965]|uniref:serine hydrolase n=1 Tax=Agromyces sp. NPDC056965 TaxID=3345983 RepID=UPI0036408690
MAQQWNVQGLDAAITADAARLGSVEWSAAVADAGTGEVLWSHHADRVLKTASVGKVFLLIEAARQAEAGELDLDEQVQRLPEDLVADSGLWHVLDVGALSIRDACALIGAVSDNLATNVLVRRLGIDRIGDTGRSLGFTASALLDRVREDRGPQHPPTLSRGNAAEFVRLMADLARGRIVSPAVSARVLGWLALNTDQSMVAAPFGVDPLAHTEPENGFVLRNKTGTISTARIDIGTCDVEGGDGGLAWAVLANWGDEVDLRDDVLERMTAIGAELRGALEQSITTAPTGS